METPKIILISQLRIGVRFSLQGIDGVFIKAKQDQHMLQYYKEGLEDLIYYADKPILKVL